MIPILNSMFRTATRHDIWDAPNHWYRQQGDYHDRRHREDAQRYMLRRTLR